jgi:putative component of membrane protein insertase Oxa1/YidC/SpoIIIJ protein YidD
VFWHWRDTAAHDGLLNGGFQEMRIILIITIQLYWRIWPQERRRSCIFRESCSHHVYRVASHMGLVAGVRALLRRFRVCRAGYAIVPIRAGVGIRLVDGTLITQDEASFTVLAPYRRAAHKIQERLMTDDTNAA